MKDLLSEIRLRPRPCGIRIQHIVYDIVHALLIRLQHLHLLLHQPSLLKEERLWDRIAI